MYNNYNDFNPVYRKTNMSQFLQTDVTAVTLFDEFILAGIGSHVHIFEKETCVHLHRLQVLNDQKIHGLVKNPSRYTVLVYGGMQFATVKLKNSNDEREVRRSDVIYCDDWLQSAIWKNSYDVAVLTAHNEVQIWNTEGRLIIREWSNSNNSLLYSGLLVALRTDVLVFAGTVFSEVMIHVARNDRQLHSLKGHRGVILSIAYDKETGIIATTSDDRSVRIWKANNVVDFPRYSSMYWEEVEIVCKYEVYSHSARVMRCTFTEDYLVSIGEDGAICYWDLEGKLLKKVLSHQNSCIWSVDGDDTHLVTGGGDGGVVLHPLSILDQYGKYETVLQPKPKHILFTAKANIVILCEPNRLVFYNKMTNSITITFQLKDESSFKLLGISSCKQIIAVLDMCGHLDLYIENHRGFIQGIANVNLGIGKILSMHWAGNRHLILCSPTGQIYILSANGPHINIYANLILPACKERWLTAAAYEPNSKLFAFGDRCGNIHFYMADQETPIKTIHKAHGRYGPTSMLFKNDDLIATGRDGSIKYYSFKNVIKHRKTIDLNFPWVEKFLDKNENLVCGFHEKSFVVYDLKKRLTLLEVPCGGGHRSWDANRYFTKIDDELEEFIELIYIKNSIIHKQSFQMTKLISANIINGSHVKEINCCKLYRSLYNDNKKLFITGGEDTTLRVSLNWDKHKFENELVFKQLSSVKCMNTFELEGNKLLLISGGGRAQITVKILYPLINENDFSIQSENILEYMIKGTDKERKGDKSWQNCTVDFDPETRIMSLEIVSLETNIFYVFAGCSDTLFRIYKLSLLEKDSTFEPIKIISYHKTCILKSAQVTFRNKQLLVTATTRGELAFWDVFQGNDLRLDEIQPIFVTQTNKSGINGISLEVLNENQLLVATGGDDNSICLILLNSYESDLKDLSIHKNISTDMYHSSLISGVHLYDGKYLLTASIDRRVNFLEYNLTDDELNLKFLSYVYSDVSDIKGLEFVEKSIDAVTLCVYGKGMEVIKLKYDHIKKPTKQSTTA